MCGSFFFPIFSRCIFLLLPFTSIIQQRGEKKDIIMEKRGFYGVHGVVVGRHVAIANDFFGFFSLFLRGAGEVVVLPCSPVRLPSSIRVCLLILYTYAILSCATFGEIGRIGVSGGEIKRENLCRTHTLRVCVGTLYFGKMIFYRVFLADDEIVRRVLQNAKQDTGGGFEIHFSKAMLEAIPCHFYFFLEN